MATAHCSLALYGGGVDVPLNVKNNGKNRKVHLELACRQLEKKGKL